MFGKNPKRSVVIGNGDNLSIKKIFKTIQGEGPFVGMPSIFIRLGGCNLACVFCDTDFEDYQTINIGDIIKEVLGLSLNKAGTRSIQLIVITGGEPLRQPIELLCKELLHLGYMVQVETNGTLYRPLPKEVHIVCSPKVTNKGYMQIREDLLENISAIKFLISKNLIGYNEVADVGQSKYNIPVFLQSMDENDPQLNRLNAEFTVQLALEHGARVSVQIHKILNIE